MGPLGLAAAFAEILAFLLQVYRLVSERNFGRNRDADYDGPNDQ